MKLAHCVWELPIPTSCRFVGSHRNCTSGLSLIDDVMT